MYDLTPTQQTIYNVLLEDNLTAKELAGKMNVSTSTIYDHISAIRSHDINITQDHGGHYVIDGEQLPDNAYDLRYQPKASQQTITKKANEYFADLELQIKPRLTRYNPPVGKNIFESREGGVDLIVPVTDCHIGDMIRKAGFDGEYEEEFNSEIATIRIRRMFDEVHRFANELREIGYVIDTVHILLGGDIVTNEVIYPGMPWDVDSNINEQLNVAIEVFDEMIESCARSFQSVQVVCQNGNHGEFNRKKASSGQANADDFLYSMLDYLIRKGPYENISVVKNEHEWHTNFKIRGGKWIGHLRHGQKTRGHVGTSSPQSDWQSWMNNTGPENEGADIAFYGHHHQVKIEPLPDGTFVIMGGSIKGPDEYAESISAYNGAMTAIHASTDDNVLEQTRYIDFH